MNLKFAVVSTLLVACSVVAQHLDNTPGEAIAGAMAGARDNEGKLVAAAMFLTTASYLHTAISELVNQKQCDMAKKVLDIQEKMLNTGAGAFTLQASQDEKEFWGRKWKAAYSLSTRETNVVSLQPKARTKAYVAFAMDEMWKRLCNNWGANWDTTVNNAIKSRGQVLQMNRFKEIIMQIYEKSPSDANFRTGLANQLTAEINWKKKFIPGLKLVIAKVMKDLGLPRSAPDTWSSTATDSFYESRQPVQVKDWSNKHDVKKAFINNP